MKKLSFFGIIFIILSVTAIHQSVFSQKTAIYQQPDALYKDGMDLFNKEKYGAAIRCFDQVIASVNDANSLMRVDAEYYSMICNLELYNDNAEIEAMTFINKHTENVHVNMTYFKLGNYLYNRKSFGKAIKIFQNIRKDELTQKELREYYFKLGYSYFKVENYEKAEKAFYEVKDAQGDYAVAARYYYGHCAYKNKKYETALKYFEKLVKDTAFGPIVPYYITQIYYLQEKYDKLLEVAVPLYKNVVDRRAAEVAKMIGDAYYKTRKFQEAIPYLETYKAGGAVATKQDIYELAFCYYSENDFLKALENFTQIPYSNDTISQNASYLMGNAYLKTEQKKEAMNAFLLADASSDAEIQEDALFKYAQLTYELDYNPYNEAIIAFQKYLKTFPSSDRKDLAQSYLMELFLTTKNYSNALEAIENIKEKDFRLLNAYQKITYFRGVEMFNDKQYNVAVELFNKSLEHQYNKAIAAQAYYWKAEAYYRLNDFDKSIENYKSFLTAPGAYSLAVYNQAQYNLGYDYFKKKDYHEATTCFRKYIASNPSNTKMLNDANVRTADCFFINKEYDQASIFYDKAIELKGTDADYSLYQKSLCMGVLGKFHQKEEALLKLMQEYPKSSYMDDAMFELANLYFATGENEQALTYYKKLISTYPNCNYIQKSMLQIGLIQYNTKLYDDALKTLKSVADNYPGTTASKEAIYTIKNVYMQMDKVDEFVNWVKTRGTTVSNDEQDSITYTSVENKYMDGECDKAISGFGNYIEKFPNGYFILNANFYKAECDLKTGNRDAALKGYEFVISQPNSKFTENALLQASAIYNKTENYEKALQLYEQLEKVAEYKENIRTAVTGELRCNFILKKYKETIETASRLISTEKVSNELLQEAHLKMAKSYLSIDSLTLAQKEFRSTLAIMNSEAAAEAKFNLAYIEYLIGRYNESEKIIFELINQVPSYDYWIANGFILLSDVYVKTGNIFQAKKTLESVKDNYEGADLVIKAKNKLAAVEEMEKELEQKKIDEQLRLQEEQSKKEQEKNLKEEKKQLEGEDQPLIDKEPTKEPAQQPQNIENK